MTEAELADDPFPVKVAKRARVQAYWCRRLGSPLYGDLIEQVADDVEAGGPFSDLLSDPDVDPLINVPMLRLMGATNRLAITGRAPELARAYADGDGAAAWEALLALARDRPGEVREHIERPVQTNEVGRCAPLAAGFLFVARNTGPPALPLRLREVGASAGLNLRFDLYRYETDRGAWGPEDSPVRLSGFWDGGEPPYDAEISVADRRGCDPAPVDPCTDEGRVTLLSYVWPDQRERVENLRGALDVAPRADAPVDRADGVRWLERELADLPAGTATVVYHSIVMPYLEQEERDELAATLARAGERARPDAQLARLSMEHGGDECELRLTTWPGGEERVLATCGFHGKNVTWLA